ncbi:HAD family hydrolase [Dactylosporangium sucinum]|uniref:Haloacid dehalogenase n=1 Tax=Dactylosporangium sucinum TaxID=1424081 RepID=A0A917UEB1_9ACTN|nr:HAD-IA family hydrolase [Dactylosporangium sucinum]GGM87013.1 haloacid dehalogenase [Dactylosporangium sucinum]
MFAVLYDFDGLLIDSEAAGLVSWQEVYSSFGHELDLEHWLAETLAGRGPCMPRERLTALLDDPVDWDEVEAKRLLRRNELLILRPGAAAHLARAEQLGAITGIVSNAPDWWISERLAAVGISESRFDVIVSKSPVLAKKPAPDAYLAALEILDILPDNALAFEDSPIGVQAAQAAGIRCVAVPNDVTRRFDLSMADVLLPRLDAQPIEELLERLQLRR